MQVTRDKELEQELFNHIRSRVNQAREGWHCSDFLYCNYKTLFRKRGEAPEPTDEQCCLYWSGFAFQAYLMPKTEEEVITIDDIQMTPDINNEYIGATHISLAELKTTRSSIAYFTPKENEQYIRQMLSYCKAKDVLESHLIVFFLMGEYGNFTTKDGRKCYTYKDGNKPFPTPRIWAYEFTQDEVDDNWEEIKRRRDILDEALKNGMPPKERIMAFEKECLYCECSVICPVFGKNNVDMQGNGF